MLVKNIDYIVNGYVKIEIQSFFIQRFINLCLTNEIILDNMKNIDGTKIVCNIYKNDFKKVCNLAKSNQSKIKILEKKGIPFVFYKYRKRKIFLVAVFCLLIGSIEITNYIWNIDINGGDEEARIKVQNCLEENNVLCGMRKSKIDIERLINKMRLENEQISWIGIKIKGTNLIVNIENAEQKPQIIDEKTSQNIVASKKGKITKINVQSGTARVKVGDEVEKGDLLVEGIMEGTYTGIRNVSARADVYAEILYEKSETKALLEEVNIATGNEQNSYILNLNNFKINLNKGVSKFKNCDTIETKKKIRLFSNYYLPIEFKKVTYRELKKERKKYTIETLTNELKTKLESEIENDIKGKYEKFINSNFEVEANGSNITVIEKYTVEEKIGIEKDLVF